MRVLLSALLVSLGLAGAASARTVFAVYGAQGDAGSTEECPAGQYMIGVSGRTGGWVDKIGVLCGTWTADGKIWPVPTQSNPTLHERGGEGGAPKSEYCYNENPHEVVAGIYIRRNPTYQILGVTMTCRHVKTGATRSVEFTGGDFNRFGPDFGIGDKDHGRTYSCPTGEVATGLVVRYGKHVNGLGLICNTLKQPTPPTTQKPPALKIAKVLKSVDVYDAPGGGGKKIGTLNAGTRNVELLGAQSPWFHVQWREAGKFWVQHVGWVYSASDYRSLKLP